MPEITFFVSGWMSAFGGKADVNQGVVKCPLLAISGHPELFGRYRRTVLSPAIPRLPLGDEPLGLGDLLRGHLVSEVVPNVQRTWTVRN